MKKFVFAFFLILIIVTLIISTYRKNWSVSENLSSGLISSVSVHLKKQVEQKTLPYLKPRRPELQEHETIKPIVDTPMQIYRDLSTKAILTAKESEVLLQAMQSQILWKEVWNKLSDVSTTATSVKNREVRFFVSGQLKTDTSAS